MTGTEWLLSEGKKKLYVATTAIRVNKKNRNDDEKPVVVEFEDGGKLHGHTAKLHGSSRMVYDFEQSPAVWMETEDPVTLYRYDK